MAPVYRFLLGMAFLPAMFATARLDAQATAIRPGVDTMTIWLVRGADTTVSGRIIDQLAITADSSGDRIVRVYTTESVLLSSRTDTIVDRLDGLGPERTVAVYSDSAYRLDFDSTRVHGDLRLASGVRRAVDLAVPPKILNSASFDLLLRGSLLRIGDSLHAVAFTPNVFGGIARLSVRIDGAEEVEGRLAWRIVGVFPPGMRVTFWIDQRTRDMVRQRMELPGGIELLLDHRPPRIAPPPRRAA